MKGKWVSFGVLIAIATGLLNTSSCAHDQKLVGINLSPAGGFVFEGYLATGQFTAYGTYIHPPETKDITSQVMWSIDIANFGTINQQGIVTYQRTDGCGSGLVNATYKNPPGNPSGSVMVASAPVSGPNNGDNKLCP
jgi:hypothetical protein